MLENEKYCPQLSHHHLLKCPPLSSARILGHETTMETRRRRGGQTENQEEKIVRNRSYTNFLNGLLFLPICLTCTFASASHHLSCHLLMISSLLMMMTLFSFCHEDDANLLPLLVQTTLVLDVVMGRMMMTVW